MGGFYVIAFLLAAGFAAFLYYLFRDPSKSRRLPYWYDELVEKHQKRLADLKERLKTLEGFSFDPSKCIVGDGLNGFAIDKLGKKICLFQETGQDVTLKVVPWRDLLEFEIVEDGSTVTHASKGPQIARAAAGALLFGGAGAIVGASLGDSTVSSKQVRRLDLILKVRDIDNPLFSVCLFDLTRLPEKVGGLSVYSESYQEARRMAAMLTVVLNESDN